MKQLLILSLLTASLCTKVVAQSTTGGRSGGSTASTGTGYLTDGKRPAETSPASMTIDDEGSARNYMYVPPAAKPNRAASPSGPASTTLHRATTTGRKNRPKS